MNRRLGGDASLNAAIREDGDSGEWQDRLVDESPNQETMVGAREEFDNRRKTLSDALTVLNKRERRIFETRRLAEKQITLVELAEEFGVSRERVRQIEVTAFAKVQNAMKHRVAAMAAPAPLQVVSFQPSPVVGETDDGRVAMGYVLRQPNAARGAPLTRC